MVLVTLVKLNLALLSYIYTPPTAEWRALRCTTSHSQYWHTNNQPGRVCFHNNEEVDFRIGFWIIILYPRNLSLKFWHLYLILFNNWIELCLNNSIWNTLAENVRMLLRSVCKCLFICNHTKYTNTQTAAHDICWAMARGLLSVPITHFPEVPGQALISVKLWTDWAVCMAIMELLNTHCVSTKPIVQCTGNIVWVAQQRAENDWLIITPAECNPAVGSVRARGPDLSQCVSI